MFFHKRRKKHKTDKINKTQFNIKNGVVIFAIICYYESG